MDPDWLKIKWKLDLIHWVDRKLVMRMDLVDTIPALA